MHERERPGGPGDLGDEPARCSVLDVAEGLVLGAADDLGEQPDVEPVAHHRRGPQRGLCRGGKHREAAVDHVFHVLRDSGRRQVRCARLVEVTGELADEERVAPRQLEHLAGDGATLGQQDGHLGPVEAAQRQVRDQLVALQVCHDGDQRMLRANLVIAVCGQHQGGGLGVADQVAQAGTASTGRPSAGRRPQRAAAPSGTTR